MSNPGQLLRRLAIGGMLAVVLCCAAPVAAQAAGTIQVTDELAYPDPLGGATRSGLLLLATNDAHVVTLTFQPGVTALTDQLRISSTDSTVEILVTALDTCSMVGADAVCDVHGTPPNWIYQGGNGVDQVTMAGPAHPTHAALLLGGDGDDQLAGGLGDEVFQGGAGTDTVSYASHGATQSVQVRNGSLASGTGTEADRVLDDVERVTGGDGDDTFTDTTGARTGFDGGGGADTFAAGTAGTLIELSGGSGDDHFVPTTRPERFTGGGGTDLLDWSGMGVGITSDPNGLVDDGSKVGGDFDDVGADIELVVGTLSGDLLVGAPVAGCRIAGAGSGDVLQAPVTGCILEGGDGADGLVGGAGPDVLRPGASGTSTRDELTFGGGSDVVDYGATSLAAGQASITSVWASAGAGATVWCHSLGVGGAINAANKFVGAVAHLDRYLDVPEELRGTGGGDTLCGSATGSLLLGGDGADNLVGGAGADVVRGGAGADTLNGQGGADLLEGEAGNDSLNGGAGIDVVDGGVDNDLVRGGGGSDTLLGGTGDDRLEEASFSTIEQGQAAIEDDAADVLDGGPGADVLDGALGDDVLACTANLLADTISDSGGGTEVIDCSGYPGAISLRVGAGIDRIVGTPYGDVIDGAATIEGGDGDDSLTGGGTLVGGNGNDNLVGGIALDGGAGNDTLVAGAAATLDGGPGSDSLTGSAGPDTLIGGPGADSLAGGAGSDSVSYADRGAAGVTVTLDGAAGDGVAGEGDNVGADVEVVVGTEGGDRLRAGSGPVTFTGNGGDDELIGSPGDDVLLGGAGNDRIAAGGGADRLVGDAGNDTLDGGTGADVFEGGAGTDLATYASRTKPVTVTLGAGRANDGETKEGDDVRGDVEQLVGGGGADRLTGSKLPNLIRGGGGTDLIDGGAGNDKAYGGAGNDTIIGGKGTDALYGEAGDDLLRAKDKVAKEIVDGGAGKKDRAQADSKDRLKRVERKLR